MHSSRVFLCEGSGGRALQPSHSLERLSAAQFSTHGRKARLGPSAGPPLAKSAAEVESFRERYRIPPFAPRPLRPGQRVRAVIGVDGGSTSSKAVLLDEAGEVVCKAYQLSKGNPIADAQELLAKCEAT
jgi:activator of 2-hydroxyglutaryl-CoA dehydratase